MAWAPSTMELSSDIFAGAARARREAAAFVLNPRRVPTAPVAGAKASDEGAATRKRATKAAVANLAILNTQSIDYDGIRI